MLLLEKYPKMLWWKQLERVQENVMMIEMEEARSREYNENATVTLTLATRDTLLQDNLLANLEHVKTLQASLFPICNKGKHSGTFLRNLKWNYFLL